VVPTFVIGLREGLEAALIVGIIAAFLVQRGDRAALRPMWLGVLAAVVLCAGVAIALYLFGQALPLRAREAMEGVLALIAVAGVTYMIVWMHRHARDLKRSLESEAATALVTGSVAALVVMAFLAVLREGLETAVFMLAAFQGSTDPAATGTGAVLGVGVAIGLGYAMYRGGVRINLARFFRLTGFVLVLVAGGLLASAMHEFSEAGLVTFLQAHALDLSWIVTPGTIQGSLLTGIFGFQPSPTLAELVVWLAYVIPMSIYVLRPAGPTSRRPQTTVAEAA
jgi:high-affinity iron transporter